ncbi:hypothetical protein HDE_10575 [Halotydeus destructor]|nr:hypothetical protein HDE_10575 [Halotydeus destructor]
MFGSRYLLSILCLSVICISVANTERDLEDNLDTAGSDVRDDDEETATQSATGNCPREFRGKCSCGKVTIWDGEQKYRRYVTNCTNTGFTDASVLRSVPVKTEMLIFTGNNLTELPQNLFGEEGEKNYSKLKIINMANNQITAITARRSTM